MRIILLLTLFMASLILRGQGNTFRAMLQAYYEEYLKLNPTTASSLGDARYNDQLENAISQPYREQSARLYIRYLDSLKMYAIKDLSERDRLSYRIFQYDLENNLARLRTLAYLEPVNQFRDFRLSFSQLGGGSGNHPFKTVKDYEDFLKRIDKFVAITDTSIVYMRRGIAAKRVQPAVVMEKVIPQIQAMLVDTVSKSLFYNPIKNLPADFSEADKKRLTADYTLAIQQQVIPAYKKLLTFIRDEYMPHTRQTVGLSAAPGGKNEYAFLVKAYTTTGLTPDEVFTLGEGGSEADKSRDGKGKAGGGFQWRSQGFL